MMKLLEICDISGKSVSRFSGNKKYIATGDIIDNKISSYSMVTYDNKPSRANIEINENEILFAKMINTRKVLLSDNDNINNIYSTGFYCIKPKDNVDINYLYYFINSEKFNNQKDKNCSGATQKAINNEGLEKITISNIPNINEQIKSANRLKKIDNLISIKKEQIKSLDELIKSQFVEMFGNPIKNNMYWEIDTLGNLGTFKNGINFDKTNNGLKISFLGVGNFKNGKIISKKEQLDNIILKEKIKEEYLLKNNDIVFVRSNGSKDLVGRSTLIKNIDFNLTFSGFCIRFRSYNENINPLFLIELFNEDGYFKQLKKDNRGANINNINQQMLTNLSIIIPPIELQNRFAQIVEQIDKQKFEFENSLKKLEELQASLMQEYFG